MPLTPDAFQTTTDGSDFYFIVLEPKASNIKYATYFGGPVSHEHVDGGTSRFDQTGIVYQAVCAGCGNHDDFPTQPGVVSQTNNSNNCNMGVIKFKFDYFVADVQIAADKLKGCVPLTVDFSNAHPNNSNIHWDFGDGLTSDDITPTHTFTDTGSYEITLTSVDSSCSRQITYDTSKITINVYDDEVISAFTYTLVNTCDSFAVILQNNSVNANNYFWSFGDGDTSTQVSPFHEYNTTGTYYIGLIAYNDTACKTLDTTIATVVFEPYLQTSIAFDSTEGCEPLTVNFAPSPVLPGSTYEWEISNGAVYNQPNLDYTFQDDGNYLVRLIVTNPVSCKTIDTSEVSIKVYPNNVSAHFEIDSNSYLAFYQMQFRNQSSRPAGYTWFFGDDETSNEFEPLHIYRSEGTFEPCLTVTDSVGCVSIYCTTIEINNPAIIDVPNAFSPNGDNVNDVLYVNGYDLETMEFRIYNRWGQLVFESDRLEYGWDGTFNGVPQEMEVYAYTLKAKFKNGIETPLRTGNITLLR
jgi:gliding motility-associated-like protein